MHVLMPPDLSSLESTDITLWTLDDTLSAFIGAVCIPAIQASVFVQFLHRFYQSQPAKGAKEQM